MRNTFCSMILDHSVGWWHSWVWSLVQAFPSVPLSHALLLNISKSLCTPKDRKIIALTICDHIHNLLKIRRNMPFMVARLLLACDTSYKPLPSLIAKSIADVTQKCAVDPDASIFGSIVNIIYFLVARKTKKSQIK